MNTIQIKHTYFIFASLPFIIKSPIYLRASLIMFIMLIGPLEDLTVQEDIADNGCQDSALLEVKGQLECCHIESKQKDKRITNLEQECHTLKVCIQELKSKLEEQRSPESILQEKDYKGETKLTSVETKPVMRVADQSKFKAEVVSMETSHSNTTELLESVRRELAAAKSQMAKQDHELEEKTKLIKTLQQEVTSLKQEVAALARDLQLCREELTAVRQQCAQKQQESDGKDERVKELENQVNELQYTCSSKKMSAGYDSKNVNSEVTALHGVIAELQEKFRCLQKEKQDGNKEAGLTNQLKNSEEFRSENKELDSKINLTLSEKEAELVEKEKALARKEAQLSALQKSLKEAQERLEEEETQAVQEARRREVERRRELLAVAEEAIAQKDAELQKRQDEVNRSVALLMKCF